MATNSWPLAEAKAKLSEVVDKTLRSGPQEITRHGKRLVVVVDAEVWDRQTRPKESLAEFFHNSPLRGMKFPKVGGRFRPVKF
jgi:prevent-host-death family protein